MFSTRTPMQLSWLSEGWGWEILSCVVSKRSKNLFHIRSGIEWDCNFPAFVVPASVTLKLNGSTPWPYSTRAAESGVLILQRSRWRAWQVLKICEHPGSAMALVSMANGKKEILSKKCLEVGDFSIICVTLMIPLKALRVLICLTFTTALFDR